LGQERKPAAGLIIEDPTVSYGILALPGEPDPEGVGLMTGGTLGFLKLIKPKRTIET
jgi:hypothetical protein